MIELIKSLMAEYSLVTAFAAIGLLVWLSYLLSGVLTRGRLHGSAIAIILGLVLAYVGGVMSGGKKGLADILSLIHI